MDLNLKGKVVVISGTTSGIGKACCFKFLQEGCKLAVTGRDAAKVAALVEELNAPEGCLYSHVGDVRNEADMKAFIDGAYNYFGRIDVLVPNAGYEGKWEYINQITVENLDKVLQTNVYGVIFMIKHAADYMTAQGKGSIVVVSSDGALLGSPGMGVYVASKHAVQAIVKTAGAELGPKGITVTSVNPGGVETPMIHRIEDNAFGNTEMTRAEKSAVFENNYFDTRYARADEIADIILFLASEKASHMFGERVSCDGGECCTRP